MRFEVGKIRTGLNRRQHRCHTCKFRVKIAGIGRAGNLRRKGRSNLLVSDVVPVDVTEEGVAHDFLRIRRARPESQFRFSHQKLLED